jgi:hypothetical protein
MSGGSAEDYKKVALGFTNALATRNYGAAYALTSNEYRDSTSLEAMQAAFEAIVPTDWKTIGPVEVGETMKTGRAGSHRCGAGVRERGRRHVQ